MVDIDEQILDINEQIIALSNNIEIIKLSNKASKSFRRYNYLTDEEIHTCVLHAIWKAIKNYEPDKGAKFTSYLYSGIVIECIEQLKFNNIQKNCKQIDTDQYFEYNTDIPKIDAIDAINYLIEEGEDKELLIDKFCNNLTLRELSKKNNITGEGVRFKIQKSMKKIRYKLA